jgi:hypothetical protein
MDGRCDDQYVGRGKDRVKCVCVLGNLVSDQEPQAVGPPTGGRCCLGRSPTCTGPSAQHGQVTDVLLSDRRDLAAARQFFTRALSAGTIPAEVTEVGSAQSVILPQRGQRTKPQVTAFARSSGAVHAPWVIWAVVHAGHSARTGGRLALGLSRSARSSHLLKRLGRVGGGPDVKHTRRSRQHGRSPNSPAAG